MVLNTAISLVVFVLFSRWLILVALKKSHIELSKSELVGGHLLLIIGSIVLGYGLATLENTALFLTLSISGGVMLFAGVVMSVRTLIVLANALVNTVKAVEDVTEVLERTSKRFQEEFENARQEINRVKNEARLGSL